MIQNIVFDMGQVLLTYQPMLPCLRHAGNEPGALRLRDAVFNRPEWPANIDLGLLTEAEYVPLAQAALDTTALREAAARLLKDWYLDALWPKDGMRPLLQELLDSGRRLYILSNTGFSFHQFEYKIPLLDRFSGMLLSCEEHLLKPNPAIFTRLCDKFSLDPADCLFIDDLPQNCEGAQAAGMPAYCFHDGDVPRLRAYLQER